MRVKRREGEEESRLLFEGVGRRGSLRRRLKWEARVEKYTGVSKTGMTSWEEGQLPSQDKGN